MTVESVLAGGPVQIAYAVDDVREAARRWARMGAGPFFVRDHIPVTDVLVHDEPGVFDHSSAYGQWGDVMVELVCVHDPSTLAGSGVHHMAWFVDSFDDAAAELANAGLTSVMSARAGHNRFAFHDATSTLGHHVEIYEGTDALRGFYAAIERAARDWDGVDPFTDLS